MSLSRKLGWAGLAATVCSGLCFAAWLFGSEAFQGSPVGLIALFIGAPALVWGVSAWTLSLGHLLDLLRRAVEAGSEKQGPGSATANSARS